MQDVSLAQEKVHYGQTNEQTNCDHGSEVGSNVMAFIGEERFLGPFD